jgi:F-type H+-transporting ATPase subunit delta
MGQWLDLNKVGSLYAKALFEHADQEQTLDETLTSLASVCDVFSRTPALMNYLENPGVAVADKKRLLEQSFSGMLTQGVTRLLDLLIENKRINAIHMLHEAFKVLVFAHEERIQAEVTSALPLDESAQQRIAQSLQATFGYKQVQVVSSVDPAILGGLTIKIGDTLIDNSYASRLARLEKSVLQV